MKRINIDPFTNAVQSVELLDEGSSVILDVPSDLRVGPGMIWNGKPVAFEFADPEPEAIEHG